MTLSMNAKREYRKHRGATVMSVRYRLYGSYPNGLFLEVTC